MKWDNRPVYPEQVFVKQYGDQRTGTNYAKALIELNFSRITVLMHILGNKHLQPAPLYQAVSGKGPEDDLRWICELSSFDPATAVTSPERQSYFEYISKMSPRICQAIRTQQLCFLISIRHPLTWCISRLRHEGRSTFRSIDTLADDLYSRAYVGALCTRFNEKYRAWKRLSDEMEQRSVIARHEDLLREPHAVLCHISSTFGVEAPSEWAYRIAGVVNPSNWDGESAKVSEAQFAPVSAPEKSNGLLPVLWDEIISTIDWPLMKCFGYTVEGTEFDAANGIVITDAI